jgi:MFS family permease
MNPTTFSPDDSIQLIRNMINKTRQDFSDNSIYFLVWGWGAFLGCTGQFILKVIYEYKHHYIVWFITIVCAVITFFIGVRDRKKIKVQTYPGESMSYLWSGLGITFFVISIIFMKIGWQYCFPFFMLLYGLGTFVSGRILKYNPLVIGGITSFILAAVSAWLTYDYQILCAAVALLASYIIPGHMLRMRYKTYRHETLQKRVV